MQQGERKTGMQKVVIADDEDRICRLIEALVDWEGIGLTLVAVAHNGIEACEAISREKPDILITDIRMPGCSGLELIEQVKKSVSELEIIIISGYAHFEYAQQAIKYGVSDYLLKPVNKAELNATLEKLKNRISRRWESEQDKEELLRKARQDDRQLRQSLVADLMDKEGLVLSREMLLERYHLKMQDGQFRVMILKMDSGSSALSEASAGIMLEKARELLTRSLEEKCLESVLTVRGSQVIGIMNYAKGCWEEIRRILKNCLNTLEMQKNLFQPVDFSMAVGAMTDNCADIQDSLKEAQLLVWERLTKGTGRVFERLSPPSALAEKNLLDVYLRDVTRAVEVLSPELADRGVDILFQETRNVPGVLGCEIKELIFSAADVFAARVSPHNRNASLENFRRQCESLSTTEQLFDCLKQFQKEHLQELIDSHENETVRPVRKAKQYIQNRFSEQITLEEVSDAVGLSPAYFSTLFKKTEGEGFAKYLIHVRMEQAKILLRETNFPASEICRKVGYNDLKHFTHTFEKTTGVKPSTYRKLYG